jgi:hypothetical protein
VLELLLLHLLEGTLSEEDRAAGLTYTHPQIHKVTFFVLAGVSACLDHLTMPVRRLVAHARGKVGGFSFTLNFPET